MLTNNSTGGDRDLHYTSVTIFDIAIRLITLLYNQSHYYAALISTGITVSAPA